MRPFVENVSALKISTPGAKRSTVLAPKLEKLAGLPSESDAPTESMPRALDGVLGI